MPPVSGSEERDEGPYGLHWLHVDAATTLELLRQHPPQREFAALSDAAYERVRVIRGRTIAPGTRIVRAVEAAVRDHGDSRLVFLELSLSRYLVVWPPEGAATAVAALEARWPQPSPGLHRIVRRLRAVAEVRALGLETPVTAALEYLLDLSRPPVLHPAFLPALRAVTADLKPTALRAAADRLSAAPTAAPTAAALLGDLPLLAADRLESSPA